MAAGRRRERGRTVGRDQILELLRGQGHLDQADRAAAELPGTVDLGNARQVRLLAGYGIDATALEQAVHSDQAHAS